MRDRAYPRAVKDAVQVAAAAGHACAVTQGGQVWCWGEAAFGQLGNGKRGSGPANAEFVPVAVKGIDDALSVAVHDSATCAVRKGGSVWCWGNGQRGQLGVEGRVAARTEPAPVPDLTDVERLVTGCGSSKFCAVRKDDSLQCWPWQGKRTPQPAVEVATIPP